MVRVYSPVDFVERSLQLLQAYPNTTKITTTYHITPPPDPSKPTRHPKPTKPTSSTSVAAPTEEKPKAPRGILKLKTYDPISGAIVTFRTDKISDVGRLVGGLHRLGRCMAGVKDIPPESTTATAVEAQTGGSAPTVSKDAVAGAVADGGEGSAAAAAAGGSKGGKKKNKKKK
ncbi:hypothetical protein H072_3558 [Dactylellina haptotyla CBS 200.50]|uniref:SRP9 domain-containing protein n=1 Tax=Dactylellina haptotyla (strain CBS 200.50) TaxID=1284197 RepID=S8C401_DACHA|nr:hypothetical protein H072_3558 [Dactylellina haptotyla CBS 200.50]